MADSEEATLIADLQEHTDHLNQTLQRLAAMGVVVEINTFEHRVIDHRVPTQVIEIEAFKRLTP